MLSIKNNWHKEVFWKKGEIGHLRSDEDYLDAESRILVCPLRTATALFVDMNLCLADKTIKVTGWSNKVS
jgi:hypothetical protein